jgi:hypothetical protein
MRDLRRSAPIPKKVRSPLDVSVILLILNIDFS